MDTRLVRRSHAPGYWVRSTVNARSLGTVERVGSTWVWEPCVAAFRGDGRPGHESDGHSIETLPPELVRPPVETRRVRTREMAVAALVDYLTTHQAPVMGFGPHPQVQHGFCRNLEVPLQRVEEVAISAW